MNSIRIGVIGPGRIWETAHKPALDLWPERVEIAAYCASSERSRIKVETLYPGVPFYRDYAELCASPDIDWVLVLTPIALNAPVATAALEAGKHVFLEKPMARSLAEAEALIETARRSARHVFVLEQAVYTADIAIIEEVMRSGEIGAVVMYDLLMHTTFDEAAHGRVPVGETTWRAEADFPLGVLFDGGHHPIARLGRLFGQPTTVYASGRQLRPTYGEFDHLLIHFGHSNGVYGTFSHGAYLPRQRTYWHIRGTAGTITVERERILIEPVDGEARMVPIDHSSRHPAMWDALLSAAESGAEPAYTLDRALDDLRTLFAIRESAREQQRVTLPRQV